MDQRFVKGAELPASIGRCADLYAEVRALRLAMEKETEEVKARESEIREHIIGNLSKSDDTGAAGLRYRAQIVMKRKFNVVSWPDFWAYVLKTRRTDLIQKRLAEKAVADFVEGEGALVPGTEAINVPDVSITKV